MDNLKCNNAMDTSSKNKTKPIDSLDNSTNEHNNQSNITHNKGFPDEMKKRAKTLVDVGLSMEEVSEILNTSKSDIEEWCSDSKV